MDLHQIISDSVNESIKTKEKVLANLKTEIESGGVLAAEILAGGGKIFFCGNGGSSCDASHLVAELIVRFKTENNRKALPAISLTGDSAIITACANDNGYDEIFSRQIEGLGRKGDLLIVLSTSGNSENIFKAVMMAKKMGIKTIALLGKTGGKIKGHCDLELIIPSDATARIQESHIMIGHIICAIIEKKLFDLN